MKRKVLVCILLFLVPISVYAEESQMKGNNHAQSQVDSLATKLAGGEIGRTEILQIPPRVLTRTRITPEMLEKQFHYKFTIRDVRGGLYQNKLVEVVKSVAVEPQPDTADLRWGVIFYGLDGERVNGIYFDKKGGNGAVGNAPCSIRGDLFKWLDENFSKCFR
jgi:hypothetical protein